MKFGNQNAIFLLTNYLLRCGNKEDPSLQVIQNGYSRYVQYCFEMFKWKESMDQVYLNCNVEVCKVN